MGAEQKSPPEWARSRKPTLVPPGQRKREMQLRKKLEKTKWREGTVIGDADEASHAWLR